MGFGEFKLLSFLHYFWKLSKLPSRLGVLNPDEMNTHLLRFLKEIMESLISVNFFFKLKSFMFIIIVHSPDLDFLLNSLSY